MTRIPRVQMRRKKEGKTDYRKRLNLLKSGQPRLVVRKSLKNMTAQIIVYSQEGDKVIASAHSKELDDYGYKFSKGNIPAAYLTGLLIAKKAAGKGIKEAIADIGLNPSTKGSRLYAVIKGAIDAGLKIPCSKEILPTDDRIKGEHIKRYAQHLGKDGSYKKQFSQYMSKSLAPEKIDEALNDAKNKILKG